MIGSITTNQQYDVAGNVVKIIDPRSTPQTSFVTTIDYTDRFGAPDGEAQGAASGAVEAVKLGKGLWEHTIYNSRLRPTQIGLGTSSGNSSLLQLDYSYGTTNNNGNVLSQTITVPGAALSPVLVMRCQDLAAGAAAHAVWPTSCPASS